MSEHTKPTPGHSDRHSRWRPLLPAIVVCTLLAGCATTGRPSDQYLAEYGYWYHDANHQGGRGAAASPQAIYNATHNTYLWPPAEVDIPN